MIWGLFHRISSQVVVFIAGSTCETSTVAEENRIMVVASENRTGEVSCGGTGSC